MYNDNNNNNNNNNNLYTIVLVTYVTVKGQATRKKPWRQGESAPILLQMEKSRKEEKS